MPIKGEKLLVCPECAKRGVTYRTTTSDDHWGCRYCDWYSFAQGSEDIQRRQRLADANPDREVWVWYADIK